MRRVIFSLILVVVGIFYVSQDGILPSGGDIQDGIGLGLIGTGFATLLEAATMVGRSQDDKKQFAELLKEVKQLRAQLPPAPIPTSDTNAPLTP